MPLDVQARGPAEQLLLDRSMVGENEPSGDARTVSPRFGNARRSSAPGDRLPREREDQGREQDHQHSGDRRRGVLRHPVAFAIGLIALLAATPAAYFYRISLLGLCRSFRSDRRRLYCGAPVRDCSPATTFGFAKSLPLARTGVRYRGLHKNADRLIVTCALANLFMARRHPVRASRCSRSMPSAAPRGCAKPARRRHTTLVRRLCGDHSMTAVRAPNPGSDVP
jgi:hypothetical protein